MFNKQYVALPSTLALCVSPDIGIKFSPVNFITSKGKLS